MPSYLGCGDDYLPDIPTPSLQQYDNYQIYDIGCVDFWYETTVDGVTTQSPITKQTAFLAVQAYSVTPIECDFIAIMQVYK
jgi:hypothetical protein